LVHRIEYTVQMVEKVCPDFPGYLQVDIFLLKVREIWSVYYQKNH